MSLDHSHKVGHSCPAHNATNRRRVGWAAVIIGAFMIVELIGGIISGSLALLADAGHMLTDFVALFMAWGAFILAARPASPHYTFGYVRVPILAAFVNGLTLFALAIWICIEAIIRFFEPGEILAGPMLLIAIIGLGVNVAAFFILIGGDQDNLNIRGAILHVLGDLLGSVAAIIAALVILKTGWNPIDPILSVFVALLILRSAAMLIKTSARILLQGAPEALNPDVITSDVLQKFPEITYVIKCHIWSVSEKMNVASFQLAGKPEALDREEIEAYLKTKFRIDEVNIQLVPSKA